MNCSEFIARFSDYYDRRAEPDTTGQMEAHLEACASCRRYHRVVVEGGQVLRSIPGPAVSSDFRPRLQHRIFHLDDEAALTRSSGSGTTGATAFAMAVLLTLAAWTPTVTEPPPADVLPPDLTQVFGQRGLGRPASEFLFQPTNVLEIRGPRERSLWLQRHSHSLLYEYSLLSTEKSRQRAQLRQTGLD